MESTMNDLRAEGSSKRRWFVGMLLAFVVAVAAMGVFWVKSLPRIDVGEDGVTISNCELPLPTYAVGVCPKLFCKKAVLESGLFPLHSQIGFDKAKPSADPLLAGSVRYYPEDGGEIVTREFVCEIEGDEVRSLNYR